MTREVTVTSTRMIARRSVLAGLAASTLAPRLAAAVDPSVVAAAKKEGEVVWYASLVQNQAVRPIVAAFQKAYPEIRVSVVTGTVNDLLLKLLDEGKAGSMRCDVSHAGSAFGPLSRAGLIESYVPAAAATFPADYKDAAGTWTAQVVSFLAPAANTTLVKDGDLPRTLADLTDPKWARKIAWTNQMSQGGPPGFIGMVLTSMGEEAGMAYLRRLAPNIVNVPANQRVVLDQVIAGQYPLALMTFTHHAELSARKGAPVRWLKLEPVIGTADAAYLLKGGPHPNAARLFLEFLLSKPGQETFRAAGYLPADPAVEPELPGLTPQSGGFRAAFVPLPVFDASVQKWIGIYNELFK